MLLRNYLLIALLITPLWMLCQKITTENDASLVIGLESSGPMEGESFTNNYMHGLIVEKPIGQFSVGLSLQYTQGTEFSGYRFDSYRYTYFTTQPTEALGRNRPVQFKHDVVNKGYDTKAGFLVYGIELKYRLPCNCFFLYSNVKQASSIWQNETYKHTRHSDEPLEYYGHQSRNLSIAYGFGLNLPISEKLRGVVKFGEERTTNTLLGEIHTNYKPKQIENRSRRSFNFSFGVHYGL